MPFLGQQPAEVALTTGDLGDDIVTEAKMANDAIGLAELKAGTDGELITWDASGNPAAVAVGTATHVLTSNGAGAVPTFQAVSGAYSVIASGTVTSSSGTEGVEFTSLTHDIHVLDIWCVEVGSAAAIELHMSSDNGSSYLSAQYDNYFAQMYAKTNGASTQAGTDNVEISLVGPSSDPMSNNGTGSAMITVTFDRNKGGAHIPYGHAICAWEPAGYAPGINVVGFKANLSAGNDIDAMKVMLSTGIWDKFKYRLIGYSI